MLKNYAKYQPYEFYIIAHLKVWTSLDFRHIDHLREAHIYPGRCFYPSHIKLDFDILFHALV